MEIKEAANVLIAHALCSLDDGGESCEMCPASNEICYCDTEFINEERLREAVNIVSIQEKIKWKNLKWNMPVLQKLNLKLNRKRKQK